MKKLVKPLISLGILVFGGLISLTLAQVISSRNSAKNNVPNYYYANYKFADDWDGIVKWFKLVTAKYSINEEISPSDFGDLAKHLDVVFPHLTEDFLVVYEKCSLLAHRMSGGYSEEELEEFMGNSCYKSLMTTINKINSSYTVRPSVIVNPSSGKVPLTVTFDARGSVDPSAETLSTDKCYWYYRDVDEVDTPMGEGQMINYTFNKPGKYIVHFVARSSNVDKGILDGEKNIEINVTPKAAKIVVYANARKMTEDWPLKIGTTEGERGVVFDGSLTTPLGGTKMTKILSHRWTITNNGNTVYDSKSLEGSPSYINVPLKGSGLFKVTLTTKDNENNTVSETFDLYLSDPVAVIRQTPSRGTTSTTFTFDGSASYSITNKLDTYYWEIFDANGGDTHGEAIKWSYDKSISINFSDLKKRPGNYLVRLTVTDVKGNQNVETNELYVESTPPSPQFTVVPTKIWTYPSEFTLDATNSTDIDVENNIDSLEYSWSFSKDDYDIISTSNNNEKMVVRFNSLGNHKITLTATDEYGVSTSVSKDLDIKSVLRPEIDVASGVVTWQENMKFKSSVNYDNIYEYDWNFGDGTNNAGQRMTNSVHQYSQKGIYTVTLKVTDNAGNRNDVKERVFVGEIDSPIAAFKVKDNKGYFLQATETCKIDTDGGIVEVDAYPIDRYAKFTIDPSYSLNTKGNSNGLKYVFSKQAILGQDKVQITNQLTDNFSELGCHYVDLQVSDTNIGKEDKVRIWFDVKNALPVLKTVTLSYPQYEDNSSFIGFGDVNTNRMSFDCSGTSSLMVKVTAVSAEDPDGMISRLRFYYYNVDDPDRKLEYKDTWMNAPYVYFSLPRVGGEYKFGLFVYDNDGGMIDSDEYLASNPSVYFPASCSDSDIPTVTLKLSSQSIQVGDNVTYTVISKLSTNNEDFATDRTFYYDFTGDGERDLVTKRDTATYQFLEAYDDGVTPRAAVEYRRKLGIAEGATIYVKNGVKPILMYNSIGNVVIFRDLSVGMIQKREICFETSECDKGNSKYKRSNEFTGEIEMLTGGTKTNISENDSFMQKYDGYGPHDVSLYLKSVYGIEAWTGFIVKTSNNENNGKIAPGVNMITIPETTFHKIEDPKTGQLKDTRAEIFLASNMDNALLMYVSNQNEGTCYVDTDIATDSDKDFDPTNDADLLCNKMGKMTYMPEYEDVIGRIYFTIKDDQGKESLIFKNFYVGFDGYVPELNDENQALYNDITILINGIDDLSVENTTLKTCLNRLRMNLNNVSEVSSLVVDISAQIENGGLKMDSKQKELLESVLSRLSNPDTVVAISVGMNDYEKNKAEILAILTSNLKQEVAELFDDFEKNVTGYSRDKREDVLNGIWDTILKNSKKNKLENYSEYFQIHFCEIFDYYDVVSDKCGVNVELKNIQRTYENAKDDAQSQGEKGGWFPLWLKILLIILVGGVLAVVGFIVFFSVKAKLNSSSEDVDEG